MHILSVKGMSCGHCVKAVTMAVEAVPQAGKAVVDLAGGTVSVEGQADLAAVQYAIEQAGFEVINAE